jgi:hypothetical protein
MQYDYFCAILMQGRAYGCGSLVFILLLFGYCLQNSRAIDAEKQLLMSKNFLVCEYDSRSVSLPHKKYSHIPPCHTQAFMGLHVEFPQPPQGAHAMANVEPLSRRIP